jgi:hypothetical protein
MKQIQFHATTSLRDEQCCDFLLTGTGSLSQSTLLAWTTTGGREPRRRIVILSRSAARARQLAILANYRAAASGCNLECTSASTSWEEADLQERIARYRPRLILHAASFQSPWPKADKNSLWRRIMREHGFGLTTALQAVLGFRVGRAAQRATPDAAFVNCCYPDAVNPLLRLAGIPVTCGTGNVAIVAAVWQSRMPSMHPARILAHHAHLRQVARPGAGQGVFPRVWIGDEENHSVPETLANVEFPKGKAMNHLTGAVTARLAQALLGERAVPTNVPGPFGLVGGYPVLAGSGKVTLDLPAGCTRAKAIAFNEEAQIAEGIQSIGKHGLRYTKGLAAQLKRARCRFAVGFSWQEIEEAAADLLSVRERLGGKAP